MSNSLLEQKELLTQQYVKCQRGSNNIFPPFPIMNEWMNGIVLLVCTNITYSLRNSSGWTFDVIQHINISFMYTGMLTPDFYWGVHWYDGHLAVGLLSPPEQEKFQFAQETVRAEAWLKAKEPLITSREPEGGGAQAQTDEVEQLILRHEAFRKAAVTWKERFSSLRQLSAVSLTVDKCLISFLVSQFNAATRKRKCSFRMCLAGMGASHEFSAFMGLNLSHDVNCMCCTLIYCTPSAFHATLLSRQ